MSDVKRILYIQPYLFFCFSPQICTEPFIRFSNYLNSKKSNLDGDIEEEYLDLRIEDLPEYWPENIDNYRDALEIMLNNIYRRFKFDIVAISCYSDFAYLNCIEVASMIKHIINPLSYIVVGGVHPSILPNTFDPENIPSYFNSYYAKNVTPIDYIIFDEGEKPFFNFIKAVLNNTIKVRKTLNEKPIFLKREFLESLDEIPPLNLELFWKYRKVIKGIGNFYIRFVRGCAFRCGFCLPSENYTSSCKKFKFRSLERCMEDINVLINTEWLKIRQLHIVDPMFFPKRSMRENFFKELEKIFHKIDFGFNVFDRIETTTTKDLDNYKKYNIIPGLGLETVSKKLLIRIDKISGKNETQIKLGVAHYLEKTKALIKYANRIKTPIVFYYMENIPGTDKEVLKERWDFFFDKDNGEKALIEKYKINLEFFMYLLFTGNTIYEKGEELYGAKYYYKHWWDIFDEDQFIYSGILKPSKDLSFHESINSTIKFVKKIFKAQMKLRNNFYNLRKFVWYKGFFDKWFKIYEKTINNMDKDYTPQIILPEKM